MNWGGKKWIKSRWHWQPRQNGRSPVGNVNYRSFHQTLNPNVPLRQWPLGKLFDLKNFNSSGPVFLFGVLFVTAYHDIMSSWHHHDIVWYHHVTSSCDIMCFHHDLFKLIINQKIFHTIKIRCQLNQWEQLPKSPYLITNQVQSKSLEQSKMTH